MPRTVRRRATRRRRRRIRRSDRSRPTCAAASVRAPRTSSRPAAAFVTIVDRAEGAAASPFSSARADRRLIARTPSHSAASPTAQAPIDAGRQPLRRDVQAEIGRADRADPPRAQAVEDQRAVSDRRRRADHRADRREDRALANEHAANSRRRESHRREHADFGGALLEADGEEEIGEQQRRHDEEETEVEEVLAEVGRALRGARSLGADVSRGESGRDRIDRLRVDRRLARQPQRRHLAVSRSPQPLRRRRAR